MSALPMTWIFETLVASTVLIGAVLVLRRPAARVFGPHAAYLLWTVPVLRLLLPPIPSAGLVSVPLAQAVAPPAIEGVDLSAIAMSPASTALTPAFDWGLALVLVWAAVALLHMAWHVVRYHRFIRGAVGAQAPAHSMGGILVYNTDVAGPAAAGIVHRRILLPYDFADRFEPRERRLALAHEVAHHRRGDLVANWIGLAVLSLHWFNPLAHIAYRAFRADQELACDATVLREASETERHAYASAVVKAAWVKSPVAACPMNSAGQLKARLAMMKTSAIQRPLVGLLVVAALAAAALGATASRTSAALPGSVAPARLDRPAQAPLDLAAGAIDRAPAALAPATPEHPVAQVATSAPAADRRGARLAQAAPTLQLAAATDRPDALPVSHAEQPATPPVAFVQTVTPPSSDHRPDRQAIAAIPATYSAMPSDEVLKASAAAAREELGTLSKGVVGVANVRAVLVDGQFNAGEPGVPFVGFCGQVMLAGESRWLPFFASATSSKAGRAAKCAGLQSAQDYSREFQPSRAKVNMARLTARGGCAADQAFCSMPFANRLGYPSATEFLYGTGTLTSTSRMIR